MYLWNQFILIKDSAKIQLITPKTRLCFIMYYISISQAEVFFCNGKLSVQNKVFTFILHLVALGEWPILIF